ncbi:MAG: hypothetical protein QOD42_1634 [Sphingomonadales bacterium]|jgi:hypothetical protein|nr:hypothetical protein [Sphingomonadales bacterium]
MIRVIWGSLVAAVAMMVIGFVFFGPLGLNNLATKSVQDDPAVRIQAALKADLPETGTYIVPIDGKSARQTALYGTGPIATIHYVANGQIGGMDTGTLFKGFVFNFAIALLIGLALIGIDGRVTDFGSRARVAAIIGIAGSGFVHLGEPIYYHHDWPHFLYAFIADGLMLAAAGIIVAWFLKTPPIEAQAAATTEAREET